MIEVESRAREDVFQSTRELPEVPEEKPMIARKTALRLCGCLIAAWTATLAAAADAENSSGNVARVTGDSVRTISEGGGSLVPDPQQIGGEAKSLVQVANLIYAGAKSSHCFSDHFLATAEEKSTISTSRRFHAVKLSSEEIFNFPLVIMTGEGDFTLTDRERERLRQYLTRGGFLLASASCSSQEWNRAFRREMATLFPDDPLQPLGMDHVVFQTVNQITELKAKHGAPKPLEGVTLSGRLSVIYSEDGLNDTAHAQGCCCCGGNEITNCIDVNVNILAYALLF